MKVACTGAGSVASEAERRGLWRENAPSRWDVRSLTSAFPVSW